MARWGLGSINMFNVEVTQLLKRNLSPSLRCHSNLPNSGKLVIKNSISDSQNMIISYYSLFWSTLFLLTRTRGDFWVNEALMLLWGTSWKDVLSPSACIIVWVALGSANGKQQIQCPLLWIHTCIWMYHLLTVLLTVSNIAGCKKKWCEPNRCEPNSKS